MLEENYKTALKKGQKAYRQKVSKGEYPYLPVLDTIVSEERIFQGQSLGTVNIPAKNVVGTRTAGRTKAFAWNFMPLMGDKTEFAVKWERLCEAHLNEGIREPIKVYEYMNRYYVEEGNKRASVLKYFDAVEITADVIRVLPPRNDETVCYYEFLDFYKLTKINYLEFTKPGSYKELCQYMGKAPGQTWTEEECLNFKMAYHSFEKAYIANGGEKLSSTVGDALLVYCRIYGYQDIRLCTSTELQKFMAKIWEEISLTQDAAPIEVKMEPDRKTEGNLKEGNLANETFGMADVLSLIVSPKTLKVAFIYDKTAEDSAWTYSHELGRRHVQNVFKSDIETTAYFNSMDGNPLAVLEQAIQEGNKLIFTVSPRLREASLRAAVDHPSVTIMNCSLNASHRYIRSYYARMYEAKFIMGALAGSLSESGKVGYICDYPIFGQIAGINAFALGAQLVNPRCQVYLEWSSVCGEAEARKHLTDQHIHLISALDMTKMQGDDRNSFGLFRHHHDNSLTNLAAPVWEWGVYYERIIRGYLNKAVKAEYQESSKAVNYYWGMSAGVVDVFASKKLPESSHRLISLLKDSIISGKLRPFQGKIPMADGQVIDYGDGGLNIEKIMNMDTLVANVVGEIPHMNKLKDDAAKSTVAAAGLDEAKKTEE